MRSVFLVYFGRRLVIFLIIILSLTACSNPDAKGKELYETAQFEEQQRNLPHAKKLDQQIINDYSQTPSAAKAKERLKALEGSPPQSP